MTGIEIVLLIVGIFVWWEFSVRVLLPLYRAMYFLAFGQAKTWHEAWEVGKLRRLQPRTREELLSGLANQKRLDDRLTRA